MQINKSSRSHNQGSSVQFYRSNWTSRSLQLWLHISNLIRLLTVGLFPIQMLYPPNWGFQHVPDWLVVSTLLKSIKVVKMSKLEPSLSILSKGERKNKPPPSKHTYRQGQRYRYVRRSRWRSPWTHWHPRPRSPASQCPQLVEERHPWWWTP